VLYPDTNTGAGYEGVTRVVTDGAKAANGTALSITGASYVLLLSRTEKYSQGAAAEWGKELVAADLAALPADYSQLRAGNVATHGDIYGRVGLDLNASEEDRALSNEALIAKQKAQTTPVLALYERVFDAGRYHYLSSSWEESPPDLLGVWTGDIDVGWQGFYHLDANVNLQISSGNIGAMPEAMAGYYYLIWGLRDGQLENARKLLGVRGQLGAGNTPGSQSGLISSIANRYYPYHYVTGEMGWLLYPFWENYLITGDKSFLANDLYPLLVDMGYFYEDFLVEVDTAGRYQQGKYIFAGSISPEAQPNGSGGNSLVNNSTFDIAGAKFCLETLIKASKILGKNIENGSVAKWQAILDMLPTYRINSDGALAEWSWPGLNDGYGHRHSSHLITVWPLKDVTAEKSPEYFAAAKETLRRKDQGSYEGAGHGLLHAALNAAGLNNGASLNSKLLSMLRTDFYYTSLSTAHYANKNTFCTDVANTVPGIMMEMLVKSDGGVSDAGVPVDGIVELLPALPEPLVTGTIYGLKNRNRTATEKLTWDMEEGKLAVTLKSDIAQSLTLIEREGIRDIEVTSGTARIAASPLGGIARVVTLPAGQSVTFAITLDTAAAPPAPPTPSDANITQGKPTTAFSESNPQQAAGMATDGSLETRWTSNQNDNDWLRVDLEGSYDVSKVIIHWEAAYGTGYRIQVSNTGGSGQSEWTTVYEATDNQSTDNEIALTNASGGWRYIRLYGLSRATEWGYSIYEFEAYGTPHAG
jgi:hypothetical protein